MDEIGGLSKQGGGIPDWVERLDKILNVSPRYFSALKSAFVRFQSNHDAHLPPARLLLASQFLVERIAKELDTKTGKLCLRPVSQDDIDALLQSDPTLNIEQPIDIQQFDEIARKLLKRIALDRGKRLGLFMLGGIMVVHLLKGTVHKIPFIGPPVGIIINVFLPTTVVGPAVGIAGAMHL
ncbi:hypothetical protein SUGI_0326140 [Cryptomeria japonica]|uniref:uncharacterized protein LOC131073768 n=1 Tax=Cryptomeria japonica TaxID=3369 RepID=UPI002408ACEB|nr:uncharacterized protein LOC131073768 [Cryptomeria japonica]GLJ18410.1 hypothetical protein SUGI_0326140 [Cryptomeria japonica]